MANIYSAFDAMTTEEERTQNMTQHISKPHPSPVNHQFLEKDLLASISSKLAFPSWTLEKKKQKQAEKAAQRRKELDIVRPYVSPCCKRCGIYYPLSTLTADLREKFEEKRKALIYLPRSSQLPFGFCKDCQPLMESNSFLLKKIWQHNPYDCEMCRKPYQLRTDLLSSEESGHIALFLQKHYTEAFGHKGKQNFVKSSVLPLNRDGSVPSKIIGICPDCCKSEIATLNRNYAAEIARYEADESDQFYQIACDDNEYSTSLDLFESHVALLLQIEDRLTYVANFAIGSNPVTLIYDMRCRIDEYQRRIVAEKKTITKGILAYLYGNEKEDDSDDSCVRANDEWSGTECP